jgi:succinate-semialdehyde dehydrogenase/glutarate-semialdehyde dehydrogenase
MELRIMTTQTSTGMNAHEASVLSNAPKQLLLQGEWRDSSDGRSFSVEDPSTRGVLCSIADATAEDAKTALDTAAGAQAAWADTDPRDRGEILRRAYELMIERIDDLALLVTLEMGKPLEESRNEVRYAAEFFRWFSEESVRIYGRWSRTPNGDSRILTMKRPVGPCLLITPWNFPLAMGARKMAPAIAAGCTMVVKAAQQTPLSMNVLAQLLIDAGLPPSVLSILTSTSASRVSGPLIADRRLRKLSFTGSTEVGKLLLAQSAENVLRTSMELGGNAPLLVFDDADLDIAVEQSYIAKMRNMGESCVAANRIYVHSSLVDEFSRRLAARMEAAALGRGTEPGVDVGPLIDDAQRQTVRGLVDDAVARGATVVTGGDAPTLDGYFWNPTVLTGVSTDARLHGEEIFGPVAAIYTFDTDDEAIALANGSEYGLVAYIFTESMQRTLRMSEQIEAGMVGVNRGLISNPAAPFGGVKWSGLGREGSVEGLDEYLDIRYVGLPVTR